MTFALCYWILMLVWLVFFLLTNPISNWRQAGGPVLIFILLLLLGWKVFGPPLHS